MISRIQACEASHHKCPYGKSTFTPSRLLRLVQCPDGSLCVVLQDTPKGGDYTKADRYTSLSYCWGGHQEFQLNAHTEATLINGIPVSSLPQTLRDAVFVTYNLGLQFIWVDCLCIRQDNPQDIALEIAQMPQVYTNSFITISAARARHSNEGFLHDISSPPISEPAFRLPFACPGGELGSVILSTGLVKSPISERAWTLQEYVLSRRVLQFTDAGLHWTCREAVGFQQDEACLALDYSSPFRDCYRMFQGFYESNRACRHWMNIVEECFAVFPIGDRAPATCTTAAHPINPVVFILTANQRNAPGATALAIRPIGPFGMRHFPTMDCAGTGDAQANRNTEHKFVTQNN